MFNIVHSRTYCDRCPTSDMSDLTCQTTGRMETGAIKKGHKTRVEPTGVVNKIKCLIAFNCYL